MSAVVKVIPVFPPQLPEPPMMADRSQLPAPVPVMSRKSTLAIDADTVPALIVLAVPIVPEAMSTRLTVELEITSNTPDTVIFAPSDRTLVFDALPV